MNGPADFSLFIIQEADDIIWQCSIVTDFAADFFTTVARPDNDQFYIFSFSICNEPENGQKIRRFRFVLAVALIEQPHTPAETGNK